MSNKTKQFNKLIIGIDEAGRGPLAGPVVAAAFCAKKRNEKLNNLRIKDSKKLTAKKREEIFRYLADNPDTAFGIGIVSERTIDRTNILKAALSAMKQAFEKLAKKTKSDPAETVLFIDGKDIIPNIAANQKAVIRGDETVWEISAASIIAKVARDRIMEKLDKKYPQYGFAAHKGYGTKKHKEAIKKYGPCPIHRITFKPLSH